MAKKTVEELLNAIGTEPSEEEARTAIAAEEDEEKDWDDLTGREKYVVQEGEDLGSIAKDLYGSVNEYHRLAAENAIENPDKIEVGQEIYYRPPSKEDLPAETAAPSVPKKSKLTSGTADEAELFQYLMDKGISSEHAQGIFANMIAESGRDAAAEGDYWVDENKDGKVSSNELWEGYKKDSKGNILTDDEGNKLRKYYSKSTKGSKPTSFGLFQWHKERGDNLKAFAKKQGKSWTDWRTQIDYMMTEPQTKAYLRKKFSDPKKATEWFTIKWEAPHLKEKKAKERAALLDNYNFEIEEREEGPTDLLRLFDRGEVD